MHVTASSFVSILEVHLRAGVEETSEEYDDIL
jgi:hypothetical protein